LSLTSQKTKKTKKEMKHKAKGQITLLALSERPAAEKTMNTARMHMTPINGKIIIFLSNKSA
jgi:hypothetical protein